MKNETYKNKYGCGLTDDITFCANECNVKRCFRNSMWIIDKEIPHSYAYFKGTGECLKVSFNGNPPTLQEAKWYWKGYEEGYRAAVKQAAERKQSINEYNGKV